MNKRLLLTACLTALCTSSIGFANSDTAEYMDDHNFLNAGTYMGLALGVGGMDTPKLSDEIKSAEPWNDEDLKGGLVGRLFGGYLWGENAFKYGAELGGMMYPKNQYQFIFYGPISYQYRGYAVDLLAVVKYHLYHFNITGKAGFGYVSQKFKLTVPSLPDTSDTKSKFLPELSAGVGYTFGPCELNLTYSYLFGKKPLGIEEASFMEEMNKNVASVSTLTLGLTYYFNSSED